MSGRLFLILLVVIAFFGFFSWNVINRLSIESIGIVIGMTLGVLSGVPTAALVLLARRRDEEDEPGDYIDVRPTPTYTPTVYHDEVTPYTRAFRHIAGMEPLPDRKTQISQLRAALDYIEAQDR